jgi:hypothetical protein
MSWSVSDRFPSWGETGESPGAGFFYEGGDQVNEKHLDYLWNSLKGLEDDVQGALNDIDSDSDGVVDKADAGAAGFDLDGDLVAANGEIIWDESANYIPQARLQNNSITINGNTVSLGGSTTVPTYSDSEAISAINNDNDHGSTAQHNYFSGSYNDLSNVPNTFTPEDHGNGRHTTNYLPSNDYNPEADTHSRPNGTQGPALVTLVTVSEQKNYENVDGVIYKLNIDLSNSDNNERSVEMNFEAPAINNVAKSVTVPANSSRNETISIPPVPVRNVSITNFGFGLLSGTVECKGFDGTHTHSI